ncbi:M20 family metallopeptidase [Erysipelothrix rhusiopathiae]|nr:M20 family metallopeptidase [Erysipelothrix rhusiopathiae]MDE8042423.1 M20 family metallopeptidase [Erysipelothrix rhusiopathiae]MDE8048994.1 M20 family metallopeptidase [Erysipelothrix rhusiopathiae]MDE8053582.1 M20 family metallopeptidase [Erysipelothrix rhusiopathiae]MDE8058775.1 M20 family metallopeptidase [Erysipelothrix rhusiopathiae]
MKNSIESAVLKRIDHYKALALDLHAHPEICNEEVYACSLLSSLCTEEGFSVTVGVAGHSTGFDARYTTKKTGPVIVFLAEYDALPGIGHACGHNLFGITSILAATALKSIIDDIGGEIRIYGTPGEEGGTNGSAKASFVRDHYFDDVDAALCVHPGYLHSLTVETLANDPVDVSFFGKPSHAAAAPELGINALEALIQVFNASNALRQHLPQDVMIHGIITDGGVAPNIVPEFAKGRFYLRANTRATLSDVYNRFENIVKGAALSTGCHYEFGLFQNAVDDTVITPSFDKLYLKHLQEYGFDVIERDGSTFGSSDVGNVSYVVPTIQPTISISDTFIAGHSPEFKAAACSTQGLNSIHLGAQLLALTALDLMIDPELLQTIKDEHQERIAKQNDQTPKYK